VKLPVVKSDFQLPPTVVAGIDLAEAFRLLRQAGYQDSALEADDDRSLLQQVIDSLCDLSLQDGLTGLANARHFRLTLEREVERAARTGEPCALLMLDLDYFKKINDTYGHPAGDQVLQRVARALSENLRPMDTVARYGGEEFAVILPNSFAAYAVQAAERLRIKIADTAIPLSEGTIVRVTISIGVACSPPWAPLNVTEFLAAADRNLYQAKAHGRNRVWSGASDVTTVSGDERAALFNEPNEP
jgi:diguanylate cyclase (GGDEF)-like protein